MGSLYIPPPRARGLPATPPTFHVPPVPCCTQTAVRRRAGGGARGTGQGRKGPGSLQVLPGAGAWVRATDGCGLRKRCQTSSRLPLRFTSSSPSRPARAPAPPPPPASSSAAGSAIHRSLACRAKEGNRAAGTSCSVRLFQTSTGSRSGQCLLPLLLLLPLRQLCLLYMLLLLLLKQNDCLHVHDEKLQEMLLLLLLLLCQQCLQHIMKLDGCDWRQEGGCRRWRHNVLLLRQQYLWRDTKLGPWHCHQRGGCRRWRHSVVLLRQQCLQHSMTLGGWDWHQRGGCRRWQGAHPYKWGPREGPLEAAAPSRPATHAGPPSPRLPCWGDQQGCSMHMQGAAGVEMGHPASHPLPQLFVLAAAPG